MGNVSPQEISPGHSAGSGWLALAGRGWPLMLRIPGPLLWLIVLVFVGLGVGLRSPWSPDEPRFALASMDMVLNGHWLLPHRGGEIYADKPPVFMWLQALGFLLTGNMKVAFLLPSALASLATAWMVHDLTRRLFGKEQALFALLALLATVQFSLQARSGQIDATVCGFTTLGLYGLVRHHCLGPSPGWHAVAWLAMGVGVITKGVGFLPVLALPGLLLCSRLDPAGADSRVPGNWKTRAAPLLLLLPPFLWLLPLALAGWVEGRQDIAAYLQEILFQQTVHRYVAEGGGHASPPWYYIVNVIPALWMPLSLLLIWLVPDWIRRLRAFSRPHWALLGFVLLGILFFSASPSKRGVYMLPLLPAVAILAGGSLGALAGKRAPVTALRTVAFVLGLSLLGLAVLAQLGHGPLPRLAEKSGIELQPALLLIMAIGLGWLLPAVLLRKGGAFTVGIGVCWLLYSTWMYVLIDPYRSDRLLMQTVSENIDPQGELAIAGFREQQMLQADRAVTHWSYHDPIESQMADAADWLRAGRDRYLLAAEGALTKCFGEVSGIEVGHRHRRDWLLVTAADLPALRCPTPDTRATRYLAPYLAYPSGP
ncbi:MAG: glycosyltransferase family 39 protein [Lysobacterales bacterium]|jgi:4-amino-4-deoxy-L-arabinose transferase-like glycosyltransferase